MGFLNAWMGKNVQAGGDEAPTRFWVTEPGFDDIGAVLSGMGRGFEYREVELFDLHTLDGCEVLFVNCDAIDLGELAPESIRRFVEHGGSVYASDWAGELIESAFPGVLHFDQRGKVQHVECDIVDSGLQQILGTEIKIHFDMDGWWRILSTAPQTRIYLSTKVKTAGGGIKGWFRRETPADEQTWDQPIVVGFSHGDGQVIYTSFHNHAQVSKAEQELLKFLVLRPILAKAAAGAAAMLQSQQCVPGQEMIASLNRGEQSSPYVYQASGNEGLMFVLHWTDPGTMRLTVADPAGNVAEQQASDQPPVQFQVPTAVAGQWTCRVEAVNVSHDNFPYVLTMATRKVSGAPVPVATGRSAGQPAVQPSPAGALWPFYLVIDCSVSTSDIAPQVGQGISALLQALKGTTPRAIGLGISIVEAREGRVSLPPLCRLNELKPLNLACRGPAAVGGAVGPVVEALSNAPFQGKALAVFVLTSESSAADGPMLASLRRLIDQGRANVIAVALGSQVSDATVKQMANIPLRVSHPHGEGTLECFQWLAQCVTTILESLERGAGGKAMNLPPLPAAVRWLK